MKLFILLMLAIAHVAVFSAAQAILPVPPPTTTTTTTAAPRVIPKTQLVVLAPWLIRPGKPYNVGIRRWGITKSINVTVTITGTNSGGTTVTVTVTANLATSSSGTMVSLSTATLSEGRYTLIVSGDGYTDKRSLTYATKTTSFVFQLNKSFFTPEQIVQFRLFAYNSETNADSSQACQISVNDPNGNVVRSWTRVGFFKGKFESEFELASNPPFGYWYFTARCGNEYAYESFEVVEDYVLPAYEAIVSIPEITPFVDGSVPVQITATYAFGDPVTGTGTFNVIYNGNNIIARPVSIVNGVVSFSLTMADLQALPSTDYYFQYTFTMTDSTLNSPITLDGYFQVVSYNYIIEFTGEQVFQPSSTYAFSIIVKDLDGTPAPLGTQVQVTISPQGFSQTLTLGSTGTVSSTTTTPTDGSSYMSFEATSANARNGYWYAYVPWNDQNTVLSLSASPSQPRLNNIVTVTASVRETVSSFVYAITSKGVLLKTDRIFFATGQRTATFTFRPDITYAPLTKIIAYYINSRGDFVTGATDVYFFNDLPNYVKFGFSNVEVRPGTNYTFSVDSKCGSTVSLNAIDTRVLQLRSDSVLTKSDILGPLYGHQWNDYVITNPNRYYPDYEWRFIDCILFPITNIPPPPQPENIFYPLRRESQTDSLRSQAKGGTGSRVRVRRDFSETFCWTSVDTSAVIVSTNTTECRNKLTCKVPDSLTKYLVYGVAMNTRYGIGLSEPPSNITTSLPLWIEVDIPYDVKRNETIVLDIVVFYKISSNQTVTISVPRLASFTGVSLTTYGWSTTTTAYVKTYRAIANTNFKVQISLRFLTLGNFPITITARSALAGDGIEKIIRIISEGIPRTITSSTIIFANDPLTNYNANLVCNYPPGTYPDTKTVTATITGDIFGTTLQNLEQLIQLPGGCCEQNLVKLVPNIAIYKYLQATGRLTPTLEADLINRIQLGVQNELGCQRSDGGFSFYSSSTSSSTWLTAYIVKAFLLVNEIIPGQVPDTVLLPAISFLQIRQNSVSGSFEELGPIVHVALQGGTGQGIALDAYVVEALRYAVNAYNSDTSIYTTYINGINYLIGQVNANAVTDVYDEGIVTYALKNAGEDVTALITFTTFYADKIELLSELKTHWQKSANVSPWFTSSLDVELTSYGLHLMLLYGYQNDAINVVRWLVSQTNQYGGFASTQDTVVALLALSEFAIVYSTDLSVDVVMTPNVGLAISHSITPANALTLYQYPLNPLANQLSVDATTTSSGIAIVSLICNFYQDPSQVVQSFAITYQFYRQCRYAIGFSACAARIPQGNSGMAIITVKMPSGFRYESWWRDSVNANVSRTEVSNGGTLVTFYVYSIGNTPTCVNVNAYRYSTLTSMRGGTITVNDYYDTFYEGTASYTVPTLTGTCWYR